MEYKWEYWIVLGGVLESANQRKEVNISGLLSSDKKSTNGSASNYFREC